MPTDQDKVIRKLRAILSADVKGYSLLIADDEVHTIQTLKAYRNIMSDIIQQYAGRVVDNPGDNLLSEFSSAIDAVGCAVQIQGRLKKENAKFVENKRLKFRIGINIGDVVHEDDRIYGSGINVAARIEGIAEPGGICISRNTYDQVKDRLDFGFEYLGEHEAKNIKEPVRIYRVLMDAESPKPLVKEHLELPDKPSIAVLPFTNMSGDLSQEYFSDGLTEQIINGLCKVSNLFVIARNSSFAYKGKSFSTKQIGQELGVKYILEGSVQRSGERVRITVQLIDASTDYHMWSENYDRDLNDIFVLQDEITMKTIEALNVKLFHGEGAKLWEGLLCKDLNAFDKLMRGLECFNLYTKEGNIQARRYCMNAIKIDRMYAFPYLIVGASHLIDLQLGWSESPLIAFEKAEEATKKALSLDDNFDMAHVMIGYFYVYKRQHDKAIKEGERAISLNPNGAEALAHFGAIQNFAGNPDKAIGFIKKAIRLNPIPPFYYYAYLGSAYRLTGSYKKAVEAFKKSLSANPDYIHSCLLLASSYSSLDHSKKAKEAAKEVLRINPNFSLEYWSMSLPYKNQNDLEYLISSLRKAGLPD